MEWTVKPDIPRFRSARRCLPAALIASILLIGTAGLGAGVTSAASTTMVAHGRVAASIKPPPNIARAINIVVFPKDSDGANALRLNKLDAYDTDSPVVLYYITQAPSAFQFAVPAINPIPIGIAVRKHDTMLRQDIQQAIKAMYRDGTMQRILKKWKMSTVAHLLKM